VQPQSTPFGTRDQARHDVRAHCDLWSEIPAGKVTFSYFKFAGVCIHAVIGL
jgi:hypothetical protein